MAAKETDPIEKISYSKWFFVIGTIFFLVSAYAFVDEIFIRRSWKEYQGKFNHLEMKRLKHEYAQKKKELEGEDSRRDKIPEAEVTEDQLSIRRIRLKREAAEIAMDGDEYRLASKELGERKIKFDDAKQAYGFAKADQDEIYYEWKHALAENHPDQVESFKKKYYELEAMMKLLADDRDQEEFRFNEAQKAVNHFEGELKRWKKLEASFYEPLVAIEKKMQGVKARTFDIEQVVINDLGKGGEVEWGKVDRCQTCHVAINREGFEAEANPFKTHPHRNEIFGSHPIAEFGCTTCHGGEGRATQIKGKPMGEGDFVHGFAKHWKHPLLRKEQVQSSCTKCHLDQWELPHADVSQKGKKLFWNLGCTGCHNVKGIQNPPKVGPSLENVASKVNQEWLMSWIKEPKSYLPHTKMPQAPLDILETGQIEKVAAYILDVSEEYKFPFGSYPGGSAALGAKTFEKVGCYGCHTLGERGTNLAPALDRIAEKTTASWIFNWIQDPQSYNAEARMPRLRLSRAEAANITAFLMKNGKLPPENKELRASLLDEEKVKEGYLIISRYGCYGCHTIKGFENASKLSVDLSGIGKKSVHELDFGDTHVPHEWDAWIKAKLKDPRHFLTEKTSSVMPDFGLSDDDIHALTTFLVGLKKEEVPERYVMSFIRPEQRAIDEGRRYVDRRNCRGCHTIEGTGRLIQDHLGEGQAPPPILDGIGARVRPEWMFNFLKNPGSKKIRPWIDIRMPTFQLEDEMANTIIQYFSGLDGVRSDFYTPTARPFMHPEVRRAAQKLMSPSYFSCYSCHVKDGIIPPGSPMQWGPDLAYARERIRPEFIPGWIKDPQKFTPGVVMPAFLPEDDAAPQDVLGGNRHKQADAIRDYLLNMN